MTNEIKGFLDVVPDVCLILGCSNPVEVLVENQPHFVCADCAADYDMDMFNVVVSA